MDLNTIRERLAKIIEEVNKPQKPEVRSELWKEHYKLRKFLGDIFEV